jgi:hypothetical protein
VASSVALDVASIVALGAAAVAARLNCRTSP